MIEATCDRCGAKVMLDRDALVTPEKRTHECGGYLYLTGDWLTR